MRYVIAGLAACLFAGAVQAGDVTVKGVHLCCGKCVKGATAALEGAEGVSGLTIDKDAGSIVFQAESSEVAQNAIAELAKAGFAGRATLGEERIKLPKINVKKGTTSNEFAIKDVHLCCGGCVNGVKEALEDVEGISEVAGDMEKSVVTIKGDGVDVRKAVQALRKAGFNGTPDLGS
ncbi:MAG: heavy-metal-associated domain-containing protein [Planctomycetaceae bacterium]|nr:heavy-metal-associated domain-containing protein [Planctomycetaceae bacterium]